MTTQAAEQAIGPRGGIHVNADNRGLVRKWLVAQGFPALFVGGLSMSELALAYNQTDGATMIDKLRHDTIEQLISRGALFVSNHSGGKDSQAMLIKLLERVPAKQLLVVHASLGEMEWPGALELAQKQAQDAGLPFIVARAEKSFLDMVERRFAARPEVPSWPSASHRQCTSDLKRGPIEREIRRYMKARGLSLVVNCTGIRAAESAQRAKAHVFQKNERNSLAGRKWYEYAPIHSLSTKEVFATIRDAGQEPHSAYAAGNERLSCVFCIMGSKNDIAHGAKAHPELFAKYNELEQRTGYTMHMSRKPLAQLVLEASL